MKPQISERISTTEIGLAKGISVRNTAMHVKKHGAPTIRVKEPYKYLNRWKSLMRLLSSTSK